MAAEPRFETLKGEIVESRTTLTTSGKVNVHTVHEEGTALGGISALGDPRPTQNPDVGNTESLELAPSPTFSVDSTVGIEFPEAPYDAKELSSRGTSLTPDGGVVKVTIVSGLESSPTPTSGALVLVRYMVYLDLAAGPFDAKSWSKSRLVRVAGDDGFCEVLEGIDIGIKSMKRKEEALLVIQPDYAYLRDGCFPLVPENATVIVRIVLDHLVCQRSDQPDNLEEHSRQRGHTVDQRLEAVVSLAKECKAMLDSRPCDRSDAEKAFRVFKAAEKLLWIPLANAGEQKRWNKIAVKVLLIGALAAGRAGYPNRVCGICRQIDTVLDVPNRFRTRLYYRWGRAIHHLASPGNRTHYGLARQKLLKALSFATDDQQREKINRSIRELEGDGLDDGHEPENPTSDPEM